MDSGWPLVPDARVLSPDEERDLLRRLTRETADVDFELALALQRELQWLEARRAPGVLPVRGTPGRAGPPRTAEDIEQALLAPVKEFKVKQRLSGRSRVYNVWRDLDRQTRELLRAAERIPSLFTARRVGYAASGVAALIGAAMERELFIRTRELRQRAEKSPPTWRLNKVELSEWSCYELLRLAEDWLVEHDEDRQQLRRAHKVRLVRNRIHPEPAGDELLVPLLPTELNDLLVMAGLTPDGPPWTLWHVLARDLPMPRGEAPATPDAAEVRG